MYPIEDPTIRTDESAFRIRIGRSEAVVLRWWTEDGHAFYEVQSDYHHLREEFPTDTGIVADGVVYARHQRYDEVHDEWVEWFEEIGELDECVHLCWYDTDPYFTDEQATT